MNTEIYGLLLTLFLGIFILIGSLIVFFTKNNKEFIKFAIGMAFGVMSMLAIFDLAPEIIEVLSEKYSILKTIIITIATLASGVLLLKIFDIFIPDHEHEKTNEEENLHHIGIVSSIALILHNIIEGMALYSVYMSNVKTAILLSIGIGLHNIPLGIVIASAFYKTNKSKKKTLAISLGISLSTFLGGFIMYLLSNNINNIIIGILLGITLGMIVYIALFELLPHISEEKDKKTSAIGILSGVILILVSLLFHHH